MILILSLLAALHAGAEPALAQEPSGYFALETIIMDAPARMGVRITRPDSTLLVEVWPAMGPGPVRAKEASLEGNRLRAVVEVHEGLNVELRLVFTGDRVAGTWRIGEEAGDLTGRRGTAPDAPRGGSRR
ncbi:MAG TPA: hypothetical protein VK928_03400 [Longimicrobiales bacterium]|nr:hypothetical protein [Longimicrobiales bacterium]